MSQDERLRELGHFLKDRRARIRPADAKLPPTPRRRVSGLRREEVAMLAGIGVSWYTSLENGSAHGVSEATLLAIADVLRLSESERHYVTELAREANDPRNDAPGPLLLETMNALVIPAYVIDAAWDVLACNAAFRHVWRIAGNEGRFNAIERLYLHRLARTNHGDHFLANVAPVVAMLRSGLGRRPNLLTLQRLRDQLLSDPAVKSIWDAYEINSPFTRMDITIESPVGTFRYQTLDLHVPGASHGIVVQVPDGDSRKRLIIAMSA